MASSSALSASYRLPIQRLRKSSAKMEIAHFQMPFKPLDPKEFDKIRQKASTAWTEEHEHRLRSITTYSAEHRIKQLDEPTQGRIRPNSPTRLHRPHPPEIFLMTHLHAIPGHNNSSKNTSNLPLRDKWKKSPSQTFGCYKPKTPSQSTMNSDEIRKAIFNDSNAAWAAESWMKLASEKDRQAVKKMIDYIRSFSGKIARKDTTGQSYISQALCRYIKPQFTTSMIHWLQKAGREESTAMERLLRSLPSDLGYEQIQGPYFRLAKSACTWEMAPKPHSYDYQIHPEWVTQPWHTQYRQHKP